MTTLAVFGAAIAMFAVLLAVKAASGLRFCVLCASIAAVWIGLLALHRFGVTSDPVLLALLMGQSVTGLTYLLEKRVAEPWLVFRLPLVLTLTLAFYFAITLERALTAPLAAVAAVWVVALVLFANRHPGALGNLARQVVACCRDW